MLREQQSAALLGVDERTNADRAFFLKRFNEEAVTVSDPHRRRSGAPVPVHPEQGPGVALELDRDNGETVTGLVLLPNRFERFIRLPGEHPRFIALKQLLMRLNGVIRLPDDQAGLMGFGHQWKSTLP
jgi:polyphosphate kinase